MKKLSLLIILAACGETSVGGACDLSDYDDLVGQNVSALSQRSDADFLVIENGEVWTGGLAPGQTIVFLDADDNILSFGCG